jgi:hypothetical protein
MHNPLSDVCVPLFNVPPLLGDLSRFLTAST